MAKRKAQNKKKTSSKKEKSSPKGGWTDYNPRKFGVFEEHGDIVEGKFIGFHEGKFGENIIIDDKDEGEVLVPSLTTLNNLIEDLHRWKDEGKDVDVRIEYTDDDDSDKGTYKVFDIKTRER